jgi:UTP:GlnB (protein PII) uridylyltransferase
MRMTRASTDRRPPRDHRPAGAGRRSPRCPKRARSSPPTSAILLAEALEGRAEIARRLEASEPGAAARRRGDAFLHDQIVRLAYDFVTTRSIRSRADLGERLAMVGLGGTGRGEMAPFSDLDLMFLTAERRSRGASRRSRRCSICCGT